MPKNLAGKPIAIAGASSGIGRATAIACAKAGMPVALGARRADKLEAVAHDIRHAGGAATTHTLDVTDEQACNEFVRAAAQAHEGLYAVFANAGYGEEKPVADTTLDEARAMFDTNFFGTLAIVRAALPILTDQSSGHVLICSSCLAFRPVPHYSMYCATKAAQHHVGQALGVELAHHGVHVSTVHPIGTRTEFFDIAADRSGGLKVAGSDERTKQPPETVARAIVRCLRRPRAEVWTSLPARLVFPLSLCAPGLAHFVLKRVLARRQARASSTTA